MDHTVQDRIQNLAKKKKNIFFSNTGFQKTLTKKEYKNMSVIVVASILGSIEMFVKIQTRSHEKLEI